MNFGPLILIFIKNITSLFYANRHCVGMDKVFEDWGLIPQDVHLANISWNKKSPLFLNV
jgi:hypothetical protein